jgi:pyruvate-formate lyase-activating enzyme
MVSNGLYLLVLLELMPIWMLLNIDLKAFTEEFYRKYTGAGLDLVLQTLKKDPPCWAPLEISAW